MTELGDADIESRTNQGTGCNKFQGKYLASKDAIERHSIRDLGVNVDVLDAFTHENLLRKNLKTIGKNYCTDARDLRFDSQAGQIRHSVVNNSPPLRCFFGNSVAQALSCGCGSRHLLHASS